MPAHGKRLAFEADNGNVFVQPADASSQPQMVLSDATPKSINAWSPDGKFLAMYKQLDKGPDLWLLPLTGDRTDSFYLQSAGEAGGNVPSQLNGSRTPRMRLDHTRFMWSPFRVRKETRSFLRRWPDARVGDRRRQLAYINGHSQPGGCGNELKARSNGEGRRNSALAVIHCRYCPVLMRPAKPELRSICQMMPSAWYWLFTDFGSITALTSVTNWAAGFTNERMEESLSRWGNP